MGTFFKTIRLDTNMVPITMARILQHILCYWTYHPYKFLASSTQMRPFNVTLKHEPTAHSAFASHFRFENDLSLNPKQSMQLRHSSIFSPPTFLFLFRTPFFLRTFLFLFFLSFSKFSKPESCICCAASRLALNT